MTPDEDDLFGPISIDEFKKSYLDQQMLHVPGPPDRFTHLFSFARMNALLRHQHRSSMQVHLVLGGSRIDPSKYYHDHAGKRRWKQGRSRIDLAAFQEYIQRGATLHLTNLHEVSDSLARFNETLERLFCTSFEIVSFTSWGSIHGFPLHFSCDEVLVLQIEGRKRWDVYRPTEQSRYPLHQADQSYHDAMQAMDRADQRGALAPELRDEFDHIKSQLVWTGVLEQGDLLYVPRGWPHQVFPLSEPSMHITCAFVPPTGIHLMELLTERLHHSPMFRRQLPRWADSEGRKRHMDQLRTELLALWEDDFAAQVFRTYDRMHTPLPRYDLRTVGTGEVFPRVDDTRLCWNPVMPTPVDTDHEQDRLSLDALGERSTFHGDIAVANDLFQFMIQRRRFTLAEVLGVVAADRAERADILEFLSQLVLDGLVSVAPAG